MADNVRRDPRVPGPEDRPSYRRGERVLEERRHTNVFSTVIRRISWGAIFAGVVIALVVQLVLSLLGLAIGFGTIDPATEANPLSGLGTGAGIWLVISSLISLFCGGLVASHLAGRPFRMDGILHGLVTWGLVTLLAVYLTTTAIGSIVNRAFGVVGQGVELLGQGVAAAAPAVVEQFEGTDITLEQIQNEAVELLRQTGDPALQPEQLEEEAAQAGETAEEAVGAAAQRPQEAEQELRSALERLLTQGEEVVTEADREDVVNILVARTDMSRAEARETVAQWEETFRQAGTEIQEAAGQLGEQATEVADTVAAAVSSAALWAFIAMVLGAIAATIGGVVGTPPAVAGPAVVEEEERY